MGYLFVSLYLTQALKFNVVRILLLLRLFKVLGQKPFVHIMIFKSLLKETLWKLKTKRPLLPFLMLQNITYFLQLFPFKQHHHQELPRSNLLWSSAKHPVQWILWKTKLEVKKTVMLIWEHLDSISKHE